MIAGLALVLLSPLVPEPKEVAITGGTLRLRESARIICTDPELRGPAQVLQSDIHRLLGFKPPVVKMPPVAGDIVFSQGGPDDRYSVSITDQIAIRAGSRQSASWGATTFLQALKGREVPQMKVQDSPDYAYRGVMLDLARKPHTISGIKQIVDLCRLYKLNYLHLHLSDDHLFMFPSLAFPNLGKGNNEFARFDPPSTDAPIRPYTRDELRQLDEYAADRGVMLIPEIDMPGHGSRLTQDAPEAFRASEQNPSTINIGSARTLEAAKTLLSELMDVFRHTPYIHLGGDEVSLGELEKNSDFQKTMSDLNIRNSHELYRRFIAEMGAFIRAKGKKMIVWVEAFSNEPNERWPLPKEAVVMAWSVNGPIQRMLAEGFSVINASWTPLYIVRDDKRPPSFLEQWEPTMFAPHTASFREWLYASGPGHLGAQICSWENAESTELQSLRLRVPILAERTWNRNSRGAVSNVDDLVERLVNEVTISTKAPFLKDENTFHESLAVEMKSAAGHAIRYRLDNRLPTIASQIYTGPITLTESAWIRAAAFDRQGNQVGPASGAWFNNKPKFVSNLATGKPVTVTNAESDIDPKIAVDGNLDRDRHWAGRTPSSLTVDLGAVQAVDRVTLVTFYDGGRYYQYTIEGSTDGLNWTMLEDASQNTGVAAASGYATKLPRPANVRFVKVTMLKNSANIGTHIVELMVFHRGRRTSDSNL